MHVDKYEQIWRTYLHLCPGRLYPGRADGYCVRWYSGTWGGRRVDPNPITTPGASPWAEPGNTRIGTG